MAPPTPRKRKGRSESPPPPSPDHGTSKRPKVTDENQQSLNHPEKDHLARAKSIFRGDSDPYLPENIDRPRALPTGEEWRFRIKYLCQPHVTDEMMKDAVQGLVKIAFPSKVLDDIGVNAIEGNMRGLGATDERIADMKLVYENEMIQRLCWLVAEKVDTSQKAETAIASMVAASHRLHGSKYDYDVLDDITSKLQRLREQHVRNTEHPRPEASVVLPLRSQSASNHTEPSGHRPTPMADPVVEENGTVEQHDIQAHAQDPENLSYWDFDLEKPFTMADVSSYFRRTYHLFAFHAIPIAQRELGDAAPRNDLKASIKRYWETTPKGERKEWKRSYEKLLRGDRGMLKRAKPYMQARVPTPAPFRNNTRIQTMLSDSDENTHIQGQDKIPVKQENQIDASGDSDSEAVNANAPDNTTVTDVNDASTSGVVASEHLQETPVVDLLWGAGAIPHRGVNEVVRCIMQALGQRVQAEEFTITPLGGDEKIFRKSGLENGMRGVLGNPKYNVQRARKLVDKQLGVWVETFPDEFKELIGDPRLFASIMPHETYVLDMFCHQTPYLSSENRASVVRKLERELSKRGIDMKNETDLQSHRRHLFNQWCQAEPLLRFVEAGLRKVALKYRSKFPELKTTPLVQLWEKVTGLSWE